MAADHATVTALRSPTDGRQREPVLVLDAVEAFLSTLRCNESPNTRRAYDNVLRRVAELIGACRALVDVDDDEIGAAITKLWGHAKPTTWNRNRAAVGSWLAWCETKARWSAPSVPGTCERRREPDDQTQAVDRAVIDRICTRRDISLRERLLWRMLYETASRANAVLALDVEDCDFDNRRARVTVKGGDTARIVWGRGTALLLPRYLRGRHSGPLFCSERRPGSGRRCATARRDICPETGRMRLGYDRARTLIKHYTGLHLHQLRHSAATHLGESGEDSSVIMAKTHHRSIRAPQPATPNPASPPSPKPPNASTHHTAETDQPEPPPPVFPGLVSRRWSRRLSPRCATGSRGTDVGESPQHSTAR